MSRNLILPFFAVLRPRNLSDRDWETGTDADFVTALDVVCK